MEHGISHHLGLVAEIRETVNEAIAKGLHVAVPASQKTKMLVTLLAQVGEHLRAVEILIREGLPTQAMAICRTMVEVMALFHGIAHDDALLKLFEKKSLERFKKKLSDLKMLDQIGGLDETIRSIHPGATSALAMDQLLGKFEIHTIGIDKRLFYIGYRNLCDFTHPDYATLADAVELLDEKSIRIRTHFLEHAEAGLGLGLTCAVATVMTSDGQNTGMQVDPALTERLTNLLHQAMDLMAPMDSAGD